MICLSIFGFNTGELILTDLLDLCGWFVRNLSTVFTESDTESIGNDHPLKLINKETNYLFIVC